MERYMERDPFTGVTVAAIMEITITVRSREMELLTIVQENIIRESG